MPQYRVSDIITHMALNGILDFVKIRACFLGCDAMGKQSALYGNKCVVGANDREEIRA